LPVTKRTLLLIAAILAVCPISGAVHAKNSLRSADPPPATYASLADFFTPGAVFQDRNGDGVIDFVDARLVVAEHPSSADLAAAADVAARLGFETSAMNLPLLR